MSGPGKTPEERAAEDPMSESSSSGLLVIPGLVGSKRAPSCECHAEVAPVANVHMPIRDIFQACEFDDVGMLIEFAAVGGVPSAEVLNSRSEIGFTPWLTAAWKGSLNVLRWLAAQKEVDRDAMTANEMAAHAVHLSVIGGHFATLHYLLAEGAAVDARDAQQCTPLIVAAQYGEVMCAQLLLRRGADSQAGDMHGDTPIHWAAYKGHEDLVSLLSQGVPMVLPVDTPDNFGQTPLHICALRGTTRVAQKLLKLGASPLSRDEKGKRPAELAQDKLQTSPPPATHGDMSLRFGRENVLLMLEPTLLLRLKCIEDKPYYFVMLFSVVVNLSWVKLLLGGGLNDQISSNVVFMIAQFLMHLTWQITHKTDPGTFGLKERDSYRKEYIQAVEEMCKLGTETYSRAAGRRLCHTCCIVRPLRTKHSGALSVNKCVPRFDHHCPWVGATIGYGNHKYFLAYSFFGAICLSLCAWIHINYLWTRQSGGTRISSELFTWIGLALSILFSVFTIGVLFSHVWLSFVKNLTTNEQINMSRYPHFMDETTGKLKMVSPFDRGFLQNAQMLLHIAKKGVTELVDEPHVAEDMAA